MPPAAPGRHAKYLQDAGHDVVGVDQSTAMLDVAAEKLSDADLRVGTLDALPLESSSVDAVVRSLALTHLPTLRPALVESARVLRPGGQVIISDVHPMFTALGLHSQFRLPDGSAASVRNHYHPHSAYIGAFTDAGLRVIKCLEPQWNEAIFDRTQRLLTLYRRDCQELCVSSTA